MSERSAAVHERSRRWAQLNGGDALHRVHCGRCAVDFSDALNTALAECGIFDRAWDETQRSWLTEVVLGVPEIGVRVSLGVARDRQMQRRVTGNDCRDIDALSMALPHCDIVVTEKLWTDLARREGLETRFGTRILAKLEDLLGALAGLFDASDGRADERSHAKAMVQ